MFTLMCRSIKRLRRPEEAPTDEEISAAALQFVRKVSGFHRPSRANEAAFEKAIEEIGQATRKLLDSLEGKPARPASRRQVS